MIYVQAPALEGKDSGIGANRAVRREPSVAQLLRNAEKNREDLHTLERIADDFAHKVRNGMLEQFIATF